MQTEAINTTTDTEVSQQQEVTQSKSFNFSLDGNIGIQMAFMTGLGGILCMIDLIESNFISEGNTKDHK